jgi:hypothetical protein
LSVTCDRSVVFSAGPPVSSTNKTDHHDITEILLKVALNTMKQTARHIPIKLRTSMKIVTIIFPNSLPKLTLKVTISSSFSSIAVFSIMLKYQGRNPPLPLNFSIAATIRDRPFNLKGGGGEVMVFCFVQNFFFGQHKS